MTTIEMKLININSHATNLSTVYRFLVNNNNRKSVS